MDSLKPSSPIDRRTLLTALGLAATATLLPGCSSSTTPETLAGPDLSHADPTIRPQDDLYRAVNGTWLARTDLVPDNESRGTFLPGEIARELDSRVPEQLRALIEDITVPAPGTPEQQVRDLYDAYLDTTTRDALGMTPLRPILDRLDTATTKAELATIAGQLPTTPFFDVVVVYESFEGPVIVSVASKTSGLPSRSDQYPAYRALLERFAGAAAFEDPRQAADRALTVEQRMAAIRADNRSSRTSSERMRWDRLTAMAPQFEWDAWAHGRTDRPREVFATVLVRNSAYVRAMAKLWNEVDIDSWRDFLRLDLLHVFAIHLTSDIAAAYNEYAIARSGSRQTVEPWRLALDTVGQNLNGPVGALYAAKYLSTRAQRQARSVVNDLLTALRRRIRHATWLSPTNRRTALATFDTMQARTGSPAYDDDYSALTITRGQLVESMLAAFAFRTQQGFAKVGKPATPPGPEPATPPHFPTIRLNDNNEIYVTASYLQAPYFDEHARAAVNYGSLGALVGLELATFLELRPHSLWESMAFDSLRASDAEFGDLFALTLAVDAYAIACERDRIQPDYQALFRSWARTWQPVIETSGSHRPNWALAQDTVSMGESASEMIATEDSEPYVPPRPASRAARCNQTARNLAQFHDAFAVSENDRLYLPADQRVTL